MKRRRVLLLGADGRLGGDLQRAHAAGAPFDLVPLSRRDLDLTRPDTVADGLADAHFNVLVNCAAYHDTDAAEDNAALAFAVNGHAVRQLAEVCTRKGARLVHISTDYVFGGDTAHRRLLGEDAPAAPVNVYGASKTLGETLARLALDNLVIVRVASLFGASPANTKRGNFVATIIRAAREQGALRVVDDQIMSPTFTADAAAILLRMLGEGCPPGTYHLVNTGAVSWFGFAESIVRRLGINASVAPCRSDESGRQAARPLFSALDNTKTHDAFGPIATWQDALGRYFRACGHVEVRSPRVINAPPPVVTRPPGSMSKPELPQCFLLGLQPHFDSTHLSTAEASRKCGANTGNLAVSFALSRHLGFPEVVNIGASPRRLNRSGRIGLVQGANQLGAHFNGERWFEPMAEIDIGLTIVGVGIQGTLTLSRHAGQWQADPLVDDIPPTALDWLARIAKCAPTGAPNIGVRGTLTQEALARRGLVEGVEVLGCPSLFINPNPCLGAEVAAKGGARGRVAVLAGNTAWPELQRTEARLAKLVSKTHGSYVGQHGTSMMEITRGEAERLPRKDLLRCRDYIRPDMGLGKFKAWCNAHGSLFFNVPAWLEHYRRFDLVVGARLHGVVLALQAGVPALCIAHDARVLELCQTMHIPHVLPGEIGRSTSVDDLARLAAFDADEFDANRRALCRRYVDFLRGNGLTPVQWLEDLAAAVPAP